MRATNCIVALLLFAGLGHPATLEEEARELEHLLIAPCCWRQPVADHLSAEADELRRGIHALLEAGKTRQEILDFYVAQYGPAILAKPPYRGFGLLGYVLPGVFVLLLGGLLWRFLARSRHAALVEPEPRPAPAKDQRYAAQLDQELRELDQ